MFFLLPAVQADFSELAQFDRASAILDSKNRARLRERGETGSKEKDSPVPELSLPRALHIGVESSLLSRPGSTPMKSWEGRVQRLNYASYTNRIIQRSPGSKNACIAG